MIISDLLDKKARGIFIDDAVLKCELIALDAKYGIFRTKNGYKETWVTADAWNGNTEIKHEVIAWMPLTEPYRAESEG